MRYKITLFLLLLLPGMAAGQQSRFLSLGELFRLGSENSLRLNASRIQEAIAGEQVRDAQAGQLPDIRVAATAGYLGQPVVFRQGISRATRPDSPDWLQNYNLSIVQPVWQGGRIRYGIERAALQKQIAALATTDDEAAVKMILLRQYLDLFSLYKQKEVFARNIEEAGRRLADIRQMKKEGLVTLNDEIRSELELNDFRLGYRETDDNISLVSQQLDILLGLDETLLLEPDTAPLSSAFALIDYESYVDQAYAAYRMLFVPMALRGMGMMVLFIAFGCYIVEKMDPKLMIYNAFFLIASRSALAPSLGAAFFNNALYRTQLHNMDKLSGTMTQLDPAAAQQYAESFSRAAAQGSGAAEAAQLAANSLYTTLQTQSLLLGVKTILGYVLIAAIVMTAACWFIPFHKTRKVAAVKTGEDMV